MGSIFHLKVIVLTDIRFSDNNNTGIKFHSLSIDASI